MDGLDVINRAINRGKMEIFWEGYPKDTQKLSISTLVYPLYVRDYKYTLYSGMVEYR